MSTVSGRDYTSKELDSSGDCEWKSRVREKTHAHKKHKHTHTHTGVEPGKEYFRLRCRSEEDGKNWYDSKSPTLVHSNVQLL